MLLSEIQAVCCSEHIVGELVVKSPYDTICNCVVCQRAFMQGGPAACSLDHSTVTVPYTISLLLLSLLLLLLLSLLSSLLSLL